MFHTKGNDVSYQVWLRVCGSHPKKVNKIKTSPRREMRYDYTLRIRLFRFNKLNERVSSSDLYRKPLFFKCSV